MTEQDEFNVRSKILASIDETDDKVHRNILLLMFGVIEQNERGMSRIEKKIDAVLQDEQAIKRMALNGHEGRHHAHHDWIEERMSEDWSEIYKWAQEKITTEKDTSKQWRKRLGDLLFEVGRGGLYLIAGMVVFALMNGYPVLKNLIGQ